MVKVSQTGGTLLDKIVEVIIPSYVVNFLNTTLIRWPYFILNYWSFVHVFTGVSVGLFFPNGFWIWLAINVVFEVTEFLLALGGNPLFVEELADSIWDVVWSMLGFVLIVYIIKKLGWRKY